MPDINAGSEKRGHRRIMRHFKIDEISAVDRPAQEGAKAVIMKRDDSPQTDFEKGSALTTAVDGHTHLLALLGPPDGVELNSGDTSYGEEGHSHPWVRTEMGIVIGEANGHRHEVDQIGKRTFSAEERERFAEGGQALPDGGFPIVTRADLSNAIQAFGRAGNKEQVARHIKRRASALGATDMLPEEGKLADLLKNEANGNKEDDPMSKEDDKNTADEQVADLTKRNDELEADLAETSARADMTDVQKAYFDGLDPQLDDDKRADFVKANSDGRQAIVEKATADDKVIYTSDDGSEYRKSDDPRLVSQARRNDELAKQLVESNEKVEKADLRKRAEDDLAHMPGTIETRMEMLKAIDGIEDDEAREAALESLKAQDAGLAKAFENVGHLSGGEAEFEKGSPSAQLDALVKEYAKEHDVEEAQAYEAVLKTVEGEELYAKSVN